MWEFLKYLVLTNVGRILLASIIIIIGAILVNEFEYNAVFYAGLILFGCQFIYMTVYMVYNMIKGWFKL